MSLAAAMRHPKIFGRFFKDESWGRWHTTAKVVDGLPLTDAERDWYEQRTGRSDIPPEIKELWFVKGRRLGFSRFASALAVHRATCLDYSKHLAAGEVGTFALIASDKKQARTLKRYVDGFVNAIPHLEAMVVKRTTEAIEFSNQTCIEIHTLFVS
jgi:hypothetical protein